MHVLLTLCKVTLGMCDPIFAPMKLKHKVAYASLECLLFRVILFYQPECESFEVARYLSLRTKGPAIYSAQPIMHHARIDFGEIDLRRPISPKSALRNASQRWPLALRFVSF